MTDPRIEIAARALCRIADGAKPCVFCDGEASSCKAYDDYEGEARAVLATLDAARPEVEVDKWQPIETAPRDGTLVLLWNKGAVEPFLARYANDRWRNNHYGERELGWYFANPTHWQPSPKPPIEATGEKR